MAETENFILVSRFMSLFHTCECILGVICRIKTLAQGVLGLAILIVVLVALMSRKSPVATSLLPTATSTKGLVDKPG
jgi:hypothetical protein